MLRDVMLPQTNVSHQKTAPKGKQATNVLCSRDEIARTASRKLLHGGMSPEKFVLHPDEGARPKQAKSRRRVHGTGTAANDGCRN